MKGRIKRVLDELVEDARLGVVLDAPTDVVLSKHDVVQPDILVILEEHRSILTAKYIAGAPDLIVEVLSPSTESRDREAKAKRYATFGVREMWLVDPDAKTTEVLVNSGEGFRREAIYDRGDTVSSTILSGLEFSAEPIFRPM